jgi:GntR family transcriptional regulator
LYYCTSTLLLGVPVLTATIAIKLEYRSGIPVYKQMTDAIIAAVQSGELRAGEKLPPIRKLSEQLNINPNTTARVYRELELKGVLESKTGSGCFVLPQEPQVLSAKEREAKLQDLSEKITKEAQSFDITEQELLRLLVKRIKP